MKFKAKDPQPFLSVGQQLRGDASAAQKCDNSLPGRDRLYMAPKTIELQNTAPAAAVQCPLVVQYKRMPPRCLREK